MTKRIIWGKPGLLYVLVFLLITSLVSAQDCNCDYRIPPEQDWLDGKKIKVSPGDTICLMPGKRKQLGIVNMAGNAEKYLVFINCGGQVVLDNVDFRYALKFDNCQYFKLTGTGDPNFTYGIKIAGTAPEIPGINISGLSSDFEIDHLEISKTGFAGIMAKTDPKCDGSVNQGKFIQKNTIIHNNYIHDVEGEGLYIGSSYFTGKTETCGTTKKVLYPHTLENVKIYHNLIENTGWDGIQVGCAVSGCEIYKNTIKNTGMAEVYGQMAGIQLNSGTSGSCYNNFIKDTKGMGIFVGGLGDNYVYNNLIINPGKNYQPADASKESFGIFCDDRSTLPGKGFHFINNTIINPKTDGIRMLSTKSVGNRFIRNTIINPGAFRKYESMGRKGNDSFIYMKAGVKAESLDNIFDREYDSLRYNPEKIEQNWRKSGYQPENNVDISRFFKNREKKEESKKQR